MILVQHVSLITNSIVNLMQMSKLFKGIFFINNVSINFFCLQIIFILSRFLSVYARFV